ncbi:MAG TPA: restriction endonuclease subunit R, partial [Chloroflexota bacterium]|nr:restriction endonuclease subunit R [Chloroflexota bacterium]
HQFATIVLSSADGQPAQLGFDQSRALWEHLKDQGYLDAHGKVQDALKRALRNGTLALPPIFADQAGQITEALRKVSGKLDIKDADERRAVPTRQAILQSPEFAALWERIKGKTTYRLQFDNEALVAACIRALRDAPPVANTRLQWRKADLAIGAGGVEATQRAASAPTRLEEGDIALPDLLTELQDRTQLTRRTIQRVIAGSGRLPDFARNPQQFIDLAAEAINRCKKRVVVDGIRYQRLGDQCYYAQELFEQEELTGYLKNMLPTQKAVYEQVVYDSDTEATFAQDLEQNTAVKVYAKLPGWFKVPTPLGTYNPDWAVLVDTDDGERLYFVVETKSSLFTDALRGDEGLKIECGKAHFRALAVGESPVQYMQARSVSDVFAQMNA